MKTTKTLKELKEDLAGAICELATAKTEADAAELAAQWARQRRYDAAQKIGKIRDEIARTRE